MTLNEGNSNFDEEERVGQVILNFKVKLTKFICKQTHFAT